MAIRAGTHVIAVDGPEDTFGVENGDFTSVHKTISAFNVTCNAGNETIEQQTTRVDLGNHNPIKGLPTGSVSFQTYAQGADSSPADGNPTTETAISHLISSGFGAAPVLPYASAVAAGTPTTIEVEQDMETLDYAVNNILPVDVDGAGRIECSPIASTAARVHALSIPLDSAPVAANAIPASIQIIFTEEHNRTCQIEVAGKDAADSKTLYGLAMKTVLDSVPWNQPQTLTFSTDMISAFKDLASATQTAPSAIRPLVAAGGRFRLTKSGPQTAAYTMKRLSVGVNFGVQVVGIPNLPSDTVRFSGFERVDADIEATIVLPHDFDPNAEFGATATSMRQMWRTGTETLQLFGQLGIASPGIFCFWLPDCYIWGEPEFGDVDGVAVQTVKLRPVHGSARPLCVVSQC